MDTIYHFTHLTDFFLLVDDLLVTFLLTTFFSFIFFTDDVLRLSFFNSPLFAVGLVCLILARSLAVLPKRRGLLPLPTKLKSIFLSSGLTASTLILTLSPKR